jgi:hypothetical protein
MKSTNKLRHTSYTTLRYKMDTPKILEKSPNFNSKEMERALVHAW